MVGRHQSQRTRRAVGSTTLAAILIVAFAAGAATIFVISRGSGESVTVSTSSATSTTATLATSTGAPSPASGLELSLTLNSTAPSKGEGVNATVEEMNPGTAPLNVSSSDKWPVQGLAVGPCGTMNQPIGLAVLSGNYDLSNVSSGKALQIYNPGVYACPMILSSIRSYVFQPSSDNATVFGSCQSNANGCFSEAVAASISVGGYWTGNSFTNFPSGVYTVVAGDEWGGLAILHFTVGGGAA